MRRIPVVAILAVLVAGCGSGHRPAAGRVSAPLATAACPGEARLSRLDPPDDLWLGNLHDAGLRHGALNVHVPPGQHLWFGAAGVYPRVSVTAFLANGTAATLAGIDFLHAGFG